MAIQIFVAKRRYARLREYRDMVKRKLGDRYELMVSPYRAILKRDAKERKQGAVVTADSMIAYLRAKGKREAWLKAVIYAATLDIMERDIDLRDIKI